MDMSGIQMALYTGVLELEELQSQLYWTWKKSSIMIWVSSIRITSVLEFQYFGLMNVHCEANTVTIWIPDILILDSSEYQTF